MVEPSPQQPGPRSRSRSGRLPEDLCFQAQQAAEKALKALLLSLKVRFPYTHDLATLLRLLVESGCQIPADFEDITELNDFAVEARYPGMGEAVTPDEYQRALAMAEHVVRWVEEELRGKPGAA